MPEPLHDSTQWSTHKQLTQKLRMFSSSSSTSSSSSSPDSTGSLMIASSSGSSVSSNSNLRYFVALRSLIILKLRSSAYAVSDQNLLITLIRARSMKISVKLCFYKFIRHLFCIFSPIIKLNIFNNPIAISIQDMAINPTRQIRLIIIIIHAQKPRVFHQFPN